MPHQYTGTCNTTFDTFYLFCATMNVDCRLSDKKRRLYPNKEIVPMNITITINTDNSAFEPTEESLEVCRILHELATDIQFGDLHNQDNRPLKDYNGNTVGKITVEG